jgi:hypothetical protein
VSTFINPALVSKVAPSEVPPELMSWAKLVADVVRPVPERGGKEAVIPPLPAGNK